MLCAGSMLVAAKGGRGFINRGVKRYEIVNSGQSQGLINETRGTRQTQLPTSLFQLARAHDNNPDARAVHDCDAREIEDDLACFRADQVGKLPLDLLGLAAERDPSRETKKDDVGLETGLLDAQQHVRAPKKGVVMVLARQSYYGTSESQGKAHLPAFGNRELNWLFLAQDQTRRVD